MNTSENQAQGQFPPKPSSEILGKPLTSESKPPKQKSPTDEEPRAKSPTKKERGAITTEPAENFAGDAHKYVCEHIHFADQKAAFIFAAVVTMLAYLHGKGVTKLWMKDPRQWHGADLFSFIAVTGLIAGAIGALLVILPRMRGAARGILFWKSIALFESGKHYADEILSKEGAELARAKLEHCFELAKVCKSKYRMVNFALWSGSIGLSAAILYLASS